MSKLVTPDSSSHWYFASGTACHEVPMKSKPGQFRSTNVGDARKMGLFPSVTNIISLLDKPQLNAWKQEQAILAALTLPRLSDEADDAFAKRIVHDATQQVRDAADRGIQIHGIIENYLMRGTTDFENRYFEFAAPTIEWLKDNVTQLFYAEKTVVGNGYAGRLDIKAGLQSYGVCIADIKTRKPYNGKLGVYDENALQLSAYLEGDAITGQRSDNRISIVINSETPEPPHIHLWPAEDHEKSFKCFTDLLSVWSYMKKYDPRTTHEN